MALSLSGHALAARGDGRGWALRFVSGWLWLAFAVQRMAWPYIITSCVYLVLDATSYLMRRKVKPKVVDSVNG